MEKIAHFQKYILPRSDICIRVFAKLIQILLPNNMCHCFEINWIRVNFPTSKPSMSHYVFKLQNSPYWFAISLFLVFSEGRLRSISDIIADLCVYWSHRRPRFLSVWRASFTPSSHWRCFEWGVHEIFRWHINKSSNILRNKITEMNMIELYAIN